jgi:hypothetical protein
MTVDESERVVAIEGLAESDEVTGGSIPPEPGPSPPPPETAG